jgi:catechol 2,3-dioxygenase-like lactoylglutathione lyase family enzyme
MVTECSPEGLPHTGPLSNDAGQGAESLLPCATLLPEDVRMVRTFGLSHIALAVRDVERSSRFYQQIFGAVEVYRGDGFAQLQTPGERDVLVLEQAPERAGNAGGVAHFGYRLVSPDDIETARQAVERAGGTVREQGEFVPGEPYLFAVDPDGYELEIWYELPTPLDPPAPQRQWNTGSGDLGGRLQAAHDPPTEPRVRRPAPSGR